MAKIRKIQGRYVIDFYNSSGQRERLTQPKGSTKEKAHLAMRELEDQLSRGVYIPARHVRTFKEVAADWIQHKKPNLRASSWSVYEAHTQNHFKELAALKINRLTVAHVEKLINAKLSAGMHILTLRKVLVTLNQICAYAVRRRYLDNNPVRDAERPRGQGGVIEMKLQVLTPEQVAKMFHAIMDLRGIVDEPGQEDKPEKERIKKLLPYETRFKYRTLFAVAVLCGLRQGEIIGLQWPDIDFDNAQIQIQRTFTHGAFYDPKTKGSRRRIDVGKTMLADLKKWKLACPPSELNLVFPNCGPKPARQQTEKRRAQDEAMVMNYSNMVKRYYAPTLKAAELPIIRFHDLRHTYASILIAQGESIPYVAKQLGHSSPTVTLNVYTHLLKPSNQEAINRLEDSIFCGNQGS